MRCNSTMTRPGRTAMVCLSGAIAAAMMLASPAWALGAGHAPSAWALGSGHHHGACGGFRYDGHHYRGGRRHYFEGYDHRHHSDMRPMDDQPRYDDPASLSAPPSRNEAC
jgi:hypothetical protein